MKIISIFFGKLFIYLCKLLKRGSSLPGKIALKFNKNLLKDLEKSKIVICVTGSSGKSSTSLMIAQTFKNLGYKICHNDKGSNLLSAVVTTMIQHSTLTGKTKADVMIFETDERFVKYIFPDLNPNYVVITNITRDQPPRQQNVDFILDEIKKGLNSNMQLILNGDDPYLRKINLENQYQVSYFSIENHQYSYKENMFTSLNIARCPYCLSKLKYKYYNFEHLGNYSCTKCNFQRPEAFFKVTSIDYINKNMIVNNNINLQFNTDILFNLYNILAAFSTLSITTNIKSSEIASALSKFSLSTKLYNTFNYKNKKVTIINNKNENSTSFNASILYVNRFKTLKTIIIGWNQISRRYDFDDLSWLYDIDFNLLSTNTDAFIVCGPQRYDIAVCLKYNGIPSSQIKIFNDLYQAKEEIYNANGDIYAILNFDYLDPFKKIMEETK